jgi:hypothetical protein
MCLIVWGTLRDSLFQHYIIALPAINHYCGVLWILPMENFYHRFKTTNILYIGYFLFLYLSYELQFQLLKLCISILTYAKNNKDKHHAVKTRYLTLKLWTIHRMYPSSFSPGSYVSHMATIGRSCKETCSNLKFLVFLVPCRVSIWYLGWVILIVRRYTSLLILTQLQRHHSVRAVYIIHFSRIAHRH